LTREQLLEASFRVECAESGKEGLRLAREIHPNAIVLDVFMPGMDGWAVITELKSDPELADIQVIMLTGSEDQEQGCALGASDYLIKPVDTGRLASVLSKYRPREIPYLALIIDDDAENRDIIRRMLEKEGWTVLEAEDGSHGLERLMESRPDLVLLDLTMPSMDGFEFVEELIDHEDWRKIPVVVMTGRDISAADRKRLNGHILKIIEKGAYSREQLVQELRNHVEASLSMIR
jgi:CheY-like chemotaxis protein